jgi:hypothetical protein
MVPSVCMLRPKKNSIENREQVVDLILIRLVLCMTLCKVCVRKYNHCRQSFNLKTLWENLNKVIFSKTGGALHLFICRKLC